VISTSHAGIHTFKSILELKNGIDEKIVTLNRKAQKGRIILENLYKKPFITVYDVVRILDVTPKTANEIIKDLQNLNILHELTGFKRNRIFVFKDYLSLFHSDRDKS